MPHTCPQCDRNTAMRWSDDGFACFAHGCGWHGDEPTMPALIACPSCGSTTDDLGPCGPCAERESKQAEPEPLARYMAIRRGIVAGTKELVPGTVLADHDADGRILGIEVIA